MIQSTLINERVHKTIPRQNLNKAVFIPRVAYEISEKYRSSSRQRSSSVELNACARRNKTTSLLSNLANIPKIQVDGVKLKALTSINTKSLTNTNNLNRIKSFGPKYIIKNSAKKSPDQRISGIYDTESNISTNYLHEYLNKRLDSAIQSSQELLNNLNKYLYDTNDRFKLSINYLGKTTDKKRSEVCNNESRNITKTGSDDCTYMSVPVPIPISVPNVLSLAPTHTCNFISTNKSYPNPKLIHFNKVNQMNNIRSNKNNDDNCGVNFINNIGSHDNLCFASRPSFLPLSSEEMFEDKLDRYSSISNVKSIDEDYFINKSNGVESEHCDKNIIVQNENLIHRRSKYILFKETNSAVIDNCFTNNPSKNIS